MENIQLEELTLHELEYIEGGSLLTVICISYLAGFATGALILYFSNK
jgi:hypothetical protein